jgi:hypothetical protein
MRIRFPWDNEPPGETAPPALPTLPEPPPEKKQDKPRGRRPAAAIRAKAQPAAAIPDWVYHRLTFSGPADMVEDFARTARGAGVVPWQLDLAALEEEVFARAVSQPASQRSLTVAGCRILAGQFRARVEAHHGRAVGLVGRSHACPFDLHVLLPVPASILQLGPTHPEALAWLRRHWGTERLRQVIERPKPGIGRRLPARHRVRGYGFFAYGGTPQPAVDRLAKVWPALRFVLQPRPAD